MGTAISDNIKINERFNCYKCNCCKSDTENIQKVLSPVNDNNNNDQNTFEVNDKNNSIFSNQLEKISFKNKFKKYLNDRKGSSLTTSSKTDLKIWKAIKIQSYIRGFLFRKKMLQKQQKIIFNKLNNVKTIKEKESEYDNVDIEDNLVMSLSMKGTIFTGEYSCKSSISINSKLNKLISGEISRFSINKQIFSFNLKSKNNIKYKYFGCLKTKVSNKQNYVISSGVVKNSSINDTKVKEGFGKLVFNDNSIFKCNFNDNKACGIGHYIDNKNNEEFIGMYKNNLPNGYGIYKNISAERKCIGVFGTRGLNGVGIEESLEDGYTYFGEFDNNQKHGNGVLQWKDGVKYEGQFFRNQMSGYAIIKYSENKVYKGQVNNGKMEGFGEFSWNTGKKYIGYYKNDKRNGFGIYIWNIPELSEGDILIGLKDINGYIGFWTEGNMNGVGLRISGEKIKYGVWKNGSKMEWIEGEDHIIKHMDNNQKKYLRIMRGNRQKILKLLSICAINDDDVNMDEEFEYIVN